MTRSALAESPAATSNRLNGTLQGDRHPRILWAPESASSAGQEAAELAAHAGLILDPWEQDVLEGSLGEREDGRWRAFEVGCLVSRQNGKGAILEARELAGLFLFGERLILHSAHEFKTCKEHFRRVVGLIEGRDDLRRRVKQITRSHGEEGIELLTGQRLLFVARTGGSGRGFTGDTVVLDEAFNLPDSVIEALMPTMSARPNPQLWYTSSAADKDVAPCDQLARVRRRGIKGGDPGLFYAEWSIDPHVDECQRGCTEHDDPASVTSWAKANPGLGIRISVEHVAREFASMGAASFAKERLGVGNWPVDESAWQVISQERWASLADGQSQPVKPFAFAADMTPNQTSAAIAVAAQRADGLLHVEVIDPGRLGTDWVVDRLIGLTKQHVPCAVVVDGAGTAGRWIAPLEAAGIEVVKPSAREAAQACGQFYDAATQGTLRHLDQPAVASALSGAQRRPLGDAWAWARKTSSVDISPLVAVTLAAWGHATRAHLAPRPYDLLGSIW